MTTEQPTTAAAPCSRCQTTGGYIARDCHRPSRTQGYCAACYRILWDRMLCYRYRTFEEAEAHVPQSGSANVARYHSNARERAQARQLAIRDHAGPHITTPRPTGQRPTPWPVEWGTPATDPLARAPWFAKEYERALAA